MPEPKNAITPEIEIAWARAVSRAFDDPSYYRYLKADPKRALTDLGADVGKVDLEAQVREAGGLDADVGHAGHGNCGGRTEADGGEVG